AVARGPLPRARVFHGTPFVPAAPLPRARQENTARGNQSISIDLHSHCAIMHDVDWDGLQMFLAVARVGRVSAAARRLGVEHTTVARRVTALEKALGVQLFYRTTRGYVLTPRGQSGLSPAGAMERSALAG